MVWLRPVFKLELQPSYHGCALTLALDSINYGEADPDYSFTRTCSKSFYISWSHLCLLSHPVTFNVYTGPVSGNA